VQVDIYSRKNKQAFNPIQFENAPGGSRDDLDALVVEFSEVLN